MLSVINVSQSRERPHGPFVERVPATILQYNLRHDLSAPRNVQVYAFNAKSIVENYRLKSWIVLKRSETLVGSYIGSAKVGYPISEEIHECNIS